MRLDFLKGVVYLVAYLEQYNIILVGFIASLVAGTATGLGALPIFLTKNVSHKFLDTMLGFAAGVMLAATSFSLIIPAIKYGGGGVRGALIVMAGILLSGIVGIGLVHIAKPILPLGLFFAAGAMLFVISDEIIPETHKHGFERMATYGLLIGFVIMMYLDITLG